MTVPWRNAAKVGARPGRSHNRGHHDVGGPICCLKERFRPRAAFDPRAFEQASQFALLAPVRERGVFRFKRDSKLGKLGGVTVRGQGNGLETVWIERKKLGRVQPDRARGAQHANALFLSCLRRIGGSMPVFMHCRSTLP